MEQFILGNTGLDPLIRTANDRVIGRFGHLNKLVNAITALQEVPPGSGLQSVVGGTGIDVDDSDPLNPTINCTITQADIASGTWTPTLGDFTGCVTDAVGISGCYTRVNNIVTATIYASVDLDFSLSLGIGYCDFDVPIATSFAERIGVGQLFQNSTDCNIASNSSKIYFYSKSSSDIGATTFTFTFQYEIN
jgi:hypothetical protein